MAEGAFAAYPAVNEKAYETFTGCEPDWKTPLDLKPASQDIILPQFLFQAETL